MWISAKALEMLRSSHVAEVLNLQAALVVVKKELAIERQKVVGLERALGVSQGNVDWMRHYANVLSEDRRSLAAAKGVDLPAPTFEGPLQTAADVTARAMATAREAGGGAPQEVGRGLDDATDVDAALAAYTGHVNGFEDLGDDEAERQGIGHSDVDGTVEYTK